MRQYHNTPAALAAQCTGTDHILHAAVFAFAALSAVLALTVSASADTGTASSDGTEAVFVLHSFSDNDYKTGVMLRTTDDMTSASDDEYGDQAVYDTSTSRSISTTLVVYSSPSANASISSGDWQYSSDTGRWRFTSYYNSDIASNGWVYIESKYSSDDRTAYWYHFDSDGYLTSGWIPSGGSWYYTSDDSEIYGQAVSGWFTDPDDGYTYYLGLVTGKMLTGWQQIDGSWYYFAQSEDADASSRPLGSLYRGEVTPDGYSTDEEGRAIL